MLVYAHRGYSGLYPENTMLAFAKAYEVGCSAMELDVHLSKDGKLVVIHDETLDRTTNAKGLVTEYTLQELQEVNAGTGDLFEPIPSLETYLEWAAKHDILTNIEIKTNIRYYPGIEELLVEMLKKYDYIDQTIISSFNIGSVIRCKHLNSNLKGAFLVGQRGLVNAGVFSKNFAMQFYHPDVSTITQEIVDECHSNFLGVNVWTVNDFAMVHKAMESKVDGIITNYPEDLQTLINAQGTSK